MARSGERVGDVVLDNPILNSPFAEPSRHWRFDEDGITDDVVGERRESAYFMPIPAARRRGGQKSFATEWTGDRIHASTFINEVRKRVGLWRADGWPATTATTRRLLQHWTRPDRARPLFFCQVEAVETAIYLTEAARRYGDEWIGNKLHETADEANPGLLRIALKMATGTGKTVVMAMLIAWQALNRLDNRQDRRFSDAFLVVTPGITIRDRLRVLLPQDPGNYYHQLDLLWPEARERIGAAKVVVTNFHAFGLRDTVQASKTTKAILARGRTESPFRETPDQMARRVCRELGTRNQIVVLNDEAHHCYRRRRAGDDAEADERLTGDDRREAERRDADARVWVSGLEAIAAKLGIKAVYDLSATPFFLRGSGYREGYLFPWVVSDFSLIDAIESGIVKIPRVPVADDASGAQPTYRDLWARIQKELPRSGKRGGRPAGGEPHLPAELEGALHSLYGNYERAYRAWEHARPTPTPPVFIVVCSNTAVSKLVFDYVAGWSKTLPDASVIPVPGRLALFSNIADGRWLDRPNTILIDSNQLESGEAMSKEFKAAAAREIEEFKAEYRTRFPGRDTDSLTDEDLLREVMNTVGKPDRLGEGVRCVVSVSMLTEGWDANTVTHVLGVRAFGTQLLCEQVVGRGLRRRSYVADAAGMFAPEYAEVYGVPFSFIPTAGSQGDPPDPPRLTRVRALAERSQAEITFPRVVGYRYELAAQRIDVRFGPEAGLTLSTQDLPSTTEVRGSVGAAETHTLGLDQHREQEVAFKLAKRLLERYGADRDGSSRPWLFPQILGITQRWLHECLRCKDRTYPQLLLIQSHADEAVDRIYRSIVAADEHDTSERTLVPVLAAHDPIGSTRWVDFETSKDVMVSDAARCHVSHVVADSGWEHDMAGFLERMPEVLRCVKTSGLDFTIPYTLDAEQRSYLPDFVVHVDDGHGAADPLQVVVEVSGRTRRDKNAKVATARTLWVPAVNAHGGFGRWAFLEVTDPWDSERAIRALVSEHAPARMDA